MEYRNRGRKLAPESYRWDSVFKLSKLANTCADGDKTKERQIRDTLKRLPIEQRVRPNTLDGGLRSSVLISTGLAWLRGQDYDLAPWQQTLADKAPSEPVKTALEPTVQAQENQTLSSENKAIKEPPEHTRYLAEVIKTWDSETLGKCSAKGLESEVIRRLKAAEKGIPFSLCGTGLSKRGEDRMILAFKNQFDKANRFLKGRWSD
jgi:hypothetical protein